MLLGTYEHTLDEKARLTLPSRLRAKLGSIVYVSRGIENNLELRTVEEFSKWETELNNLESFKKDSRLLKRYIFSNSAEIDIDKTGRIKIPQNLLTMAKIDTNNREVIILGVGSKLEIWNKQVYEQHMHDDFERIGEIADAIR